MDTPASSSARRRRWPIVLVVLLLLAVFLVFAAPRLAAPFVRKRVVATLEERFPVRAHLDDLGFGVPPWARVGGFAIDELDGQRIASVSSVEVNAELWPLLRGAVDAKARVRGVEVHLRQDAEGRWNFEKLLPAEEAEPGPDAEDSGTLPDVALDFELRDALVVVHAPGGATELRDLELDLVLQGLDRPGRYRVSGDVVGPDGPGGIVRGEGEWTVLADAGKQGALDLTIEGLLMRALEPALDLALEERPPALDDPAVLDGAIDLTFHADVSNGLDAIDVTTFDLSSPLVSGGVTGRVSGLVTARAQADPPAKLRIDALQGELTYVPDRLAPLLAPFLPERASFSGSEPETARFALDGELDPGAPVDELLEGIDGEVSVGLGQLAMEGLRTAGTVTLGLRDDVAELAADLGANGGGIRLRARADLTKPAAAVAEAAASTGPEVVLGEAAAPLSLELSWDAVGMCAAFAPLLSKLHPVFAKAQGLAGNSFEGLLSGNLQLRYDAPFSLDGVLAGELPSLAPLVASGEVAIDKARLASTPFLDQLLAQLGTSVQQREVSMDPIAFHVEARELTYDRAWKWTIDGTPTIFTGAFGFDQSIDMKWKVPIGDGLIRRFGELESLRGKSLTMPIGGTVTHPKFGLTEAVATLARSALEEQAQDKLDELEDKAKDKLDEIVGGDAGDVLDQVLGGKGTSTSGEDPNALLKEADGLWNDGKKAEAAKLYQRIRSEHKLSAAYLLNKKRVKERASFQE